jgi:hypothetical protein
MNRLSATTSPLAAVEARQLRRVRTAVEPPARREAMFPYSSADEAASGPPRKRNAPSRTRRGPNDLVEHPIGA